MSGRYRQNGEYDAAVAEDGDAAFVGVDMRRQPEKLEPGLCAQAVNMEFTLGEARPRGGMRTKPWARELGAPPFPWTFPISFELEQGFGQVFGACVFTDPYGQAAIMIACAKRAYRIVPNAPAEAVAYPASGGEITDRVTFTQAYNVLLLWRGEYLDPWKFETAQDFSAKRVFEVVPKDEEESEDYTSRIPAAKRGLYFGNRVWVFYNRSLGAFSDILSYTRYDADFSEIYVNQGDDDSIMASIPFGDNAIMVLKSRSIYAITGVQPQPRTTAALQIVTTERGTVAPDTVVQAGNDVLFLSTDGVYAISQALDNKLQAGVEPLSAPIAPLIARINWAYAENAQAVVHGNRYYLAVPLDGATYNNAILVFDYLTRAWAGHWEGDWVDVFALLRISVSGELRLVMVTGNRSSDARLRGTVMLMDDGFYDLLFGETRDVQTRLVSRGYLVGTTLPKKFVSGSAVLSTWNGAGSITVRGDAGASHEARAYDKERGKSTLFGKPDWDPTNVNGDHAAPGREDYSLTIVPGMNWSTGIMPTLHAQSIERFRLRETARSVQVEIQGSRGRTVVKAITVAAGLSNQDLRTDN